MLPNIRSNNSVDPDSIFGKKGKTPTATQNALRRSVGHPLNALKQEGQLTIIGSQFVSWITAEVQKFVAQKRINEQTIHELDQKVQMESYLREKREAILEDRKGAGAFSPEPMASKGSKVVNSNTIQDEDAKSCLQQVQERY